jgi:gamma-glutamyltranspeptidase/glutathione hydrolase
MNVVTGRSKIATKYGIVAASQPLAARAGVQVLERGGHAVDAAIAANAVMGLVEPHMNGLGGDLFAIVYEAKKDAVYGLNAAGWAPRGLTPALLKARNIEEMPADGIHSVTVPGAVAGWEALRLRFGRLPMSDILAPAIFYATHGFPVSDIIAAAWATLTEKLAAEPEAARTYLPKGRPPRGEVFRNPAREVAAAHCREGRAAFYEGRIADAILALAKKDGTLAAADLQEFDAEWVEPCRRHIADGRFTNCRRTPRAWPRS